jgi:response regulator RpfG family c-di-GMP phosphodiesterase
MTGFSAGSEPAHIIATDDDPKLLAAVTNTLRDAGYTVFALYNGISATEAALRVPRLDLIVANTRIQGVSIVELIRRVREARPDIPVLHFGEPVQEPFPLVANLREPWTEEQLLGLVAELLHRR